jgi:hypothetical protein
MREENLMQNQSSVFLLGIVLIKKTYKLFDPNSHKLIESRYVVFHENEDRVDTNNDAVAWHNDSDEHAKIDAMVKQEQEQVHVRE